MRTLLTWGLVALFGLALAACGNKANLHGIVTDVDGSPIGDAAATIEGSTAVGMSGATGEFSVAWMPGSHKVVVGKVGYLSYSTTVEATEAGDYDLGTIQLQPTPPDKGLWLYDSSAFTTIQRVVLEKGARGKGRTFCLIEGAPDPTQVPAGDVMFFDWSQLERHLIRMTEDQCAGIRETSRWIIDDELGEVVDVIADDMKLRKVTLEPGHYVYADWTNGWFRSEASYFQVK
jgi:hypothetical protein